MIKVSIQHRSLADETPSFFQSYHESILLFLAELVALPRILPFAKSIQVPTFAATESTCAKLCLGTTDTSCAASHPSRVMACSQYVFQLTIVKV